MINPPSSSFLISHLSPSPPPLIMPLSAAPLSILLILECVVLLPPPLLELSCIPCSTINWFIIVGIWYYFISVWIFFYFNFYFKLFQPWFSSLLPPALHFWASGHLFPPSGALGQTDPGEPRRGPCSNAPETFACWPCFEPFKEKPRVSVYF